MQNRFKKQVGKLLEKIGLKKLGIRIDLKINTYYRDFVNYLRSVYIPMLVRKRIRTGILAINLDSDWLGLGARIVATIELLMYAEENGLLLEMKYGYRRRGDNYNYYEDLFEDIAPDKRLIKKNKEISYTHVRNVFELGLKKNYNKLLNCELANNLFNRHVKITGNIMTEVDHFYNYHFKGSSVLALHYRGTDKVGEAPKVELDFVYNFIVETLDTSAIKFDKLFISSDELSCIELFQQRKLPLEIISRDDIYRSSDGKQFHRDPSNNISVINQEALINCLLLSKCNLLIKTASILSDCCKIFNPDLPMIILNEPHSSNLIWWPATELNKKYLYKIPEKPLKSLLQ